MIFFWILIVRTFLLVKLRAESFRILTPLEMDSNSNSYLWHFWEKMRRRRKILIDKLKIYSNFLLISNGSSEWVPTVSTGAVGP